MIELIEKLLEVNGWDPKQELGKETAFQIMERYVKIALCELYELENTK